MNRLTFDLEKNKPTLPNIYIIKIGYYPWSSV